MIKERIFWLGMHKVLVETELKELRALGYEVFNPPYLSKIYDQSANLQWKDSKTSLPENVYEKLKNYNFFYNSISEEIRELINSYFDVVIVTIHPNWLLNILKFYKGKIIFRTYGSIHRVSELLTDNGSNKLIMKHDDFIYAPFCNESLEDEEPWLKSRAIVIPYWLTDDIGLEKNTWNLDSFKLKEIGIACPNINNYQYKTHFKYLKQNFEERHYKYFGVQPSENKDFNVVGTLERSAQINYFKKLSGFLYTYRNRNVCYLPPIEMMTLGGPVIFFPGSLLHRFFDDKAPGMVINEDDARKKSKFLLKKDKNFVIEVTDSQKDIVDRYSKEKALVIFKKAYKEILSSKNISKMESNKSPNHAFFDKEKSVLIIAHFNDAYFYKNGEHLSLHGITRVMRQFNLALNSYKIPVTISALKKDLEVTRGFYTQGALYPNLIKIKPIEDLNLGLFDSNLNFLGNQHVKKIRKHIETFFILRKIISFTKQIKVLRNSISSFVKITNIIHTQSQRMKNLTLQIPSTKKNSEYLYIVIPHYYLFPELLKLNKENFLLYLPDFIPHFFNGRDVFLNNESHIFIGKELATKAKFIMTNSIFTKNYLHQTPLDVKKNKIINFPMVFLNSTNIGEVDYQAISLIINKEFILYPTQPHPNKRLDLLIKAWITLCRNDLYKNQSKIYLVLTAGAINPELIELIKENKLYNYLVLIPSINDSTLRYLYINALCLTITSEVEGNFPTQIIEAIQYNCPVVAMDNPLLYETIKENEKNILISPFADIDSFVLNIIKVKKNKKKIIAKQRKILPTILHHHSFDNYKKNVLNMHKLMLE
jgi:glycosyltransferase involved in cell wall biosynthesis